MWSVGVSWGGTSFLGRDRLFLAAGFARLVRSARTGLFLEAALASEEKAAVRHTEELLSEVVSSSSK